MNNSVDLLFNAYLKLKQEIYYEQLDLFVRNRLAEFEADGLLKQKIHELANLLDDWVDEELPTPISALIDKIDYHIIPKVVGSEACLNVNSQVISNCKTSENYDVQSVHYLIDAPVELLILDTAWCILNGKENEKVLGSCCYGNRLNYDKPVSETNVQSLFKLYHKQYSMWRDGAVDAAKELYQQGHSSLIIALDIKNCFYSVSPDWSSLSWTGIGWRLNLFLKVVHERYHKLIYDSLRHTHSGLPNLEQPGLPIGLLSSRILCNLILNDLDNHVNDRVFPIFYGRYVDDILVVVKNPSSDSVKNGAEGFLKEFLLNTGIVISNIDDSLEFSAVKGAVVQKQKLLYYYFDKSHSIAGLYEFIEKTKHAASEFRFLPEEDEWHELNKCAYDILYKGSANKLRSVIDVTENATKLSQFFSRCMIAHRLTNSILPKEIVRQCDKFWQGLNIIDFFRLWEKYLTLLVIKSKTKEVIDFTSAVDSILMQLKSSSVTPQDWLEKLRDDLRFYFDIALATPLSLLSNKERSEIMANSGLSRSDHILTVAQNFRSANLLRHQYVAWPMLNFSSYEGNLASILDTRFLNSESELLLSSEKLELSPRFVHDDEKYLFHFLESIKGNTFRKFIFASFTEINESTNKTKFDNLSLHEVKHEDQFMDRDFINIAVANMPVLEQNIVASCDKNLSPDISYNRQLALYKLLNRAKKEDCDILILPEVSVPYYWLPFLVAHARRNQIGLTFGLEHWVCEDRVYNFLVTVLPYKINQHNACFVSIRNKNHLAPQEEYSLITSGLKPVMTRMAKYDLINWWGVSFTVFNCYELSDIIHRAAFRSRIDLLITVEHNRDTTYYAELAGSIARDLHCYVVMVNSSEYGDSKIIAPRKNEDRTIVQVKGGENVTLLKASLDIEELKAFQKMPYDPNDKSFKPKPAGYETEILLPFEFRPVLYEIELGPLCLIVPPGELTATSVRNYFTSILIKAVERDLADGFDIHATLEPFVSYFDDGNGTPSNYAHSIMQTDRIYEAMEEHLATYLPFTVCDDTGERWEYDCEFPRFRSLDIVLMILG